MKSSYYLDTLRGRSQELPGVRSKVVRVFVSSTFTDTLTERDSLIENIFPKLKDYCREKYGLEFQYADMRWGIQSESANNHSETATCLKEIELCKKYSVATNFVVLLSHRYGSRPISAQIPAHLFELLKTTVLNEQNENNDADLLTEWYKLDTNSVPGTYVLQNITSFLPDFASRDTEKFKQADREWKMINNQLRNCLRRAAATCLERQQITESDYDEFFISVTEKEIIDGILNAKDANERTLCFLREIVDIREHLSDEKAAKYIDVVSPSTDEKPTIDHEADKLLDRLKTTRIPNSLRSENIYKYRVRWSPKGINRKDHIEYIQQFNEDFHRAIKEQIDRCVEARFSVGINSLHHEVLEHSIQCKTYVSKFHGRIDVLSELENYVKNSAENRPCIVYGDSGCGKTSVLAKTATEVFKWWSDRSVSVILRFLGTTPPSSTIYKTLLSISQQICEIYDLRMTIYPTVNQLRDQLELNLLSQIPDDEYLLILLDSIDQLHTDAYDCKWLLKSFPSNVKCVISTLPDHGDIYTTLRQIFIGENHLFVNVPPFEPDTVTIVYDDWLRMKKRSLSIEQRTFIQNLMNERRTILPLFMKLLFDIFSIWRSYDPIDERIRELKDIDDCIRYLFSRLKIIHNETLFSRALCYMTACRSGISQNELEDVLSLDDDVLKSVFQHYIPPVRRLPGILWTRIRNDLDEYITEKEVDDAPVIYWYHRRFIEVARERFLGDLNDQDRKIIFQNVVDLFKETWKGKNKPFKIDDPKLVNKYQLNSSQGEISANRFTTSQPIEFIDADGKIQYNKRKLNELPQFLSKLAVDIAIPIAAEEIFFNYSFIHGKFACSTYVDIQSDIDTFENLSSFKCPEEILKTQKEMRVLSLSYLIFGVLLNDFPDNYAFEVTARLLALYNTKPNITKLIQQCDEQSPRHCALIVPYQQISPPGNGLLYSLNKHTMPVIDFDFVNNHSAAISLSNKIVAIDMTSGNAALDINLPIINEPYLNSTTMPKMITNHEKSANDDDDDDNDSNVSISSDDENFKKYVFFVNSAHHIYLVSSHGDLKFHRQSSKGFSFVEVLDRQYGLCLIVENDSSLIECWNVGQNLLCAQLDFENRPKIKSIISSKLKYPLVTVVFDDGTIEFYFIKNSKFEHRGTINAGPSLDLVAVDRDHLICTYDATVPIDFVHMSLEPLVTNVEIATDKNSTKTLIEFRPSIQPKPIKKLLFLSEMTSSLSHRDGITRLFFVAVTTEALYIVHICSNKNLSYVRIPGQFDLVTLHAERPDYLYVGQGGTISLYKWKCLAERNGKHSSSSHLYQLYVSFDISSSAVLTIKPTGYAEGMFLCSLDNGTIQAYQCFAARNAFKKVPPFPRATRSIDQLKLINGKALTLDKSNEELNIWTYRHSTSIDWTNSSVKIVDFTLIDDRFVVILSEKHSLEIYSLKSLKKLTTIFRLDLRYSARIFLIDDRSFFVLTSDGLVRSIVFVDDEFRQTSSKQLEISSKKFFATISFYKSKKSLVVLADDRNSLSIWNGENLYTMKIDLSSFVSLELITFVGQSTDEFLLFHFDDKTLLSFSLTPNTKTSSIVSFGQVNFFDVKSQRLVTMTNQLDFFSIFSSKSERTIELNGEGEHLSFNQSASYVFVLLKPRILLMYRVNDGRSLARLFLPDFVTKIDVDNDFLVLAMNDRRLLTLFIADPDDPQVTSKINALPSRNVRDEENQLGKEIFQQIEAFLEQDSDDCDGDLTSDDEEDSDDLSQSKIKTKSPDVFYRFVARLNSRRSTKKMQNEDKFREHFIWRYFDSTKFPSDFTSLTDYSDEETDVIQSPSIIEENFNLDEIRKKTTEFDREQIKTIQMANAGTQNPRIINNSSLTSATCAVL